MDHTKFWVKVGGHSLELKELAPNRPGEAHFCWTCQSDQCVKISLFNENYVVKIDPKSHKGWHVVEAK